MALERTLCIIKPDAVEKRKQGAILQRLQEEGFKVLGLRQTQLSRPTAEGFYAVHSERPFFQELCTFMTRGPVVVIALERENASTYPHPSAQFIGVEWFGQIIISSCL